MAVVKIMLEPDESQLDADITLQKALEFQSSGDIHAKESFEDPAMVHVAERMEQIHDKNYADMVREIIDELEKQYSDGY